MMSPDIAQVLLRLLDQQVIPISAPDFMDQARTAERCRDALLAIINEEPKEQT